MIARGGDYCLKYFSLAVIRELPGSPRNSGKSEIHARYYTL